MRQKAGFTLIEMLVVIALVAFAASVVAPRGFGIIESTERFFERKKEHYTIEKLQMQAFLTGKKGIIKNQKVYWENDNTTVPFPYSSQGILTQAGAWRPQ